MPSLWDTFMPIIKRVSTPDMLEDLAFYRAHDRELYFTGLVGVAVMLTILEILFIGLALFFLYYQQFAVGFILFGVSVCIGIGFTQIKLYLHVRKDAIEIKELLRMRENP